MQPLLAARLFAAAAALREQLDLSIALADQPRHELAVRATQRGVESAAWAAAWGEGRSLSPAQAIAHALAHASSA